MEECVCCPSDQMPWKINNRVDIDSDNDGIVDVIKLRFPSASPQLPVRSECSLWIGSDDERFDSDLGSVAYSFQVNTDGTDTQLYRHR